MIELKNLSGGYDKRIVLDDITVSLPKNQFVSVIGPNGAGKSTLLKIIGGIIPRQSGEVIIDGQTITDMPRNEIAQKVSYLAQGRNIPDMTVKQLVQHGRFPYLSYPRRYTKNDREIAYKAMEQMNITEFVDRPVSTLSGGERQKAYIAMALTQDTDYVLLDEPTTYLDISHQIHLMKTLRELTYGGKSVIAVMHDLPLTFTFSDFIVVMKDGGIVTCDTPLNICKNGVLKEVFGIELQYSETDGRPCMFYKFEE